MEKIKVSEIPNILDECYKKGTDIKPYSVLFVSDQDAGVKKHVEFWMKNKKVECSFNYPHNFAFRKGIIQEPIPSRLKDSKIAFIHYEYGYGSDLDYKKSQHEAYLNLINKKGYLIADDLRLVITRVYYPLWNNNHPMYGEDDYKMFDAVYHVEMCVEDVLDDVNKKIIDLQKEYSDLSSDESKEYIEDILLLIAEAKMTRYILRHPKFRFISIKEVDGLDFDGLQNRSYCTPYTIEEILQSAKHKLSNVQYGENFIKCVIEKIKNTSKYSISEETRNMFLEIMNDCKYDVEQDDFKY